MTFSARRESIASAAFPASVPSSASVCHARTGSPHLGLVLGIRPAVFTHGARSDPEVAQQLEALLEDAEFARLIDFVTAEVTRAWHIPRRTAAGFVMSAVGAPKTLACVHREWFSARAAGTGFGLAQVIVRRRVLDLLRGDARRPGHESLPRSADALHAALGSCADRAEQDPHAQAELNQVVEQVRSALRCFAEQGPRQARQAGLVRRYAIDEISHADLAAKLACSPNALRVRLHKAMRALRRHIETCHPELGELLGRRSAGGAPRSATTTGANAGVLAHLPVSDDGESPCATELTRG